MQFALSKKLLQFFYFQKRKCIKSFKVVFFFFSLLPKLQILAFLKFENWKSLWSLILYTILWAKRAMFIFKYIWIFAPKIYCWRENSNIRKISDASRMLFFWASARSYERTLIWAHACLGARLFEHTLVWARAYIWVSAYLSASFFDRTLF